MAELFHKTFAADLSEFDATAASNGTIAQAAGSGLNGTTGGVLCTRTANSPNLYGRADTALFSGKTVLRTAWYTDLASLTIGTDGHNTALLRAFGDTGIAALVVVYRVSGALRHALYLYNDSGTPTTAAAVFGLPDWMELRVVRASGIGVSDGEAQLYAGGGAYAALGELLLEVTGIPNYGRFNQVYRFIIGMHNALAASTSVGGSLKFDEWTLRDDDTPILFGVSESTTPPYLYLRRRRRD